MHIGLVVYILIGNCARVSTIYLFNRFNSLHINIVNKCYFCTKIKLINMIKSNFEYPRKVSNPTRQIRQISPTVLLSNCEVSDTLHFPKQAFNYNDVMHLYRMRIMELRKKCL